MAPVTGAMPLPSTDGVLASRVSIWRLLSKVVRLLFHFLSQWPFGGEGGPGRGRNFSI